ncbi:hypothetical protein BT69DRAFT_1281642 [Atractiella rhizophila]|nr:hypothetical protein BT69DRAFT_1281642 [Atractiella rhizophila]
MCLNVRAYKSEGKMGGQNGVSAFYASSKAAANRAFFRKLGSRNNLENTMIQLECWMIEENVARR